MKSRTILTHLLNGNPEWLRIVEFSNRYIKWISFPRAMFEDVAKRDELSHSWVYFLFWEDENEQEKVYIGQSLNIVERLKNHLKSPQKDFWLNTVCFIKVWKDNLNSAEVNYIENQLINKSNHSWRIYVENSTWWNKEHLTEFEISDMNEFIIDLDILLWILGYPILNPLISTNKSWNIINSENKVETIYYLKRWDCEWKMVYTNEWYIVLKGSIWQSITDSWIRDWIWKRREKLISEWVLQLTDNNRILFLKNHVFKSPSGWWMIIAGSSINWWWEWKNEKWISLWDNEKHWQ